MKPISIDKREIVIAAKARGEKPEIIALWTGIAVSSVHNICRQHRETNSLEPKPYPGRVSVLTSEQLAKIKEAVEDQNDITLEEIIEKLGLPIKKSRLSVILIGMGFSFKKRHSIQKRNSEKTSSKNGKNGENYRTV